MTELIKAGMPEDMPAAVIERGTTARQRQVCATVKTLKQQADEAKIKAPAIIVVGKVCSLSEEFHWIKDRILGGKQFLVTRPRQNQFRSGKTPAKSRGTGDRDAVYSYSSDRSE